MSHAPPARNPWPLRVFHAAFVVFMLAPLLVVVLVSFTDKGYIALPFDGASWRWYRAILAAPDFIDAFWRSQRDAADVPPDACQDAATWYAALAPAHLRDAGLAHWFADQRTRTAARD